MLRMMVARSPGRASWAKNATVAAPHSTTSDEPTVRAVCRRTAGPRRGRRAEVPGAATVASLCGDAVLLDAVLLDEVLLDEMRVIERRSPLCVLLPDVLQLRRDRERAQPVVDPDRERVLGDVVLGLDVVLVLAVDVRFRVAARDEPGEGVVVVERAVAVVRAVRGARPPVDPEDPGVDARPVADAEVVRVGTRVLPGEVLADRGRDELDVEAGLRRLLLDPLEDRGAVGVDDGAGAVRQLDGQRDAVLRPDAVRVLLAPARRVEQRRGLLRVEGVRLRRIRAVAGRRLAHA